MITQSSPFKKIMIMQSIPLKQDNDNKIISIHLVTMTFQLQAECGRRKNGQRKF